MVLFDEFCSGSTASTCEGRMYVFLEQYLVISLYFVNISQAIDEPSSSKNLENK